MRLREGFAIVRQQIHVSISHGKLHLLLVQSGLTHLWSIYGKTINQCIRNRHTLIIASSLTSDVNGLAHYFHESYKPTLVCLPPRCGRSQNMGMWFKVYGKPVIDLIQTVYDILITYSSILSGMHTNVTYISMCTYMYQVHGIIREVRKHQLAQFKIQLKVYNASMSLFLDATFEDKLNANHQVISFGRYLEPTKT